MSSIVLLLTLIEHDMVFIGTRPPSCATPRQLTMYITGLWKKLIIKKGISTYHLFSGFNFTLSNLVIVYILPTVILVFMLLMIYCRKLTDNNKFRRYVKLLTMLSLVFFISRSPMDILQLKGIVEAAMGFKQLNLLPYQLEYEILLVWSTYLPLLLNPVVYFCFCSEYRSGGWRAIRSMCGCPLPTEDEKLNLDTKYKEVEIMSSRSSISKTQKSNML